MPRIRPTPRMLMPVLAIATLLFVYLVWVEASDWPAVWERLAETPWTDHERWQHELDAHRHSCDRIIGVAKIATALAAATAVVAYVFSMAPAK